ncbi:MAG: threonine ammonia-lyase [Rhizomicrobium sp.]|jgi:threonine dehydratase
MSERAAAATAVPAFPEVTLAHIRAAADLIRGSVVRTPTRAIRTRLAGCEVWFKLENLQFTASFKERGALNKLSSLGAEQRKLGVVAMSAGNHAQAVAYHAGRFGIPAVIVMPEGTPFNKVKQTKDFGAEIVIEGATLNDSYVRARKIADDQHMTLIHPYDDPVIVAGAGTVGLELMEDVPELDTLVVPIGGGGLISGIAIAAKALKPSIAIYGVEAELYPSMYDALKGASLPCGGQTIAEGIAVKRPGELTQPIVRALVDDVLLVRENEIESAVVTLLETEKTVVEGAAAAAFAAVRTNPDLFAGRKIGIVLSGGNIDMRLLSNVILRDLSRVGRILSLVIEIEDRPGWLAGIATVVGNAGGNILEVTHNRMMMDMPAKSADLGLVIEARDAGHAAEVRAQLEKAGFRIRAPKITPSRPDAQR